MLTAFIPNAVWQLLFVCLSLFGWVSALYWWRKYLELQRLTRRGGYVKPPASIHTSQQTGTPLTTGKVTLLPTTEVFRLMSEPGLHSLRWDILETLPTPPLVNSTSSRGESGLRMVEDGAEASGPTPPGSAA